VTPEEVISGPPVTLLQAGLLGPAPRVGAYKLPEPACLRKPEPPPEKPRTMLDQKPPQPVIAAGGGATPWTIRETDGTPSVAGVDLVQVPNGTLTDLGGGDVSLNYESPIHKNVAGGYAGLNASGFVDIARGGTNAGDKTAAFDNLAPTTTKGDLTVHDGTDNVRVPVGANGQVLTADSAEATGVKWATPATATEKKANKVLRAERFY
jgi:hypothetical protein